MKKALVTGANGFVGSNLCRELISSGYQVYAMHRASSDLSTLAGLDCNLVCAELADLENLTKKFADIDVVFHIAALFREAKHADDVYFKVNLEGTKNVFEAAISAGVKKVIYCSTTGVMGDIEDPPADETYRYAPGDVYQVSKMQAEKLAIEYYKSGKITGCVIRPAMIWGPGDRRLLKLFKGRKNRTLPIIGDGKTLFHFIYVSDLAKSFRLAAENNNINAEIFIIAGKEYISIKRLFNTISESFNVEPLAWSMPALPVYLLAVLVESICKPLGVEPPLFRRRVKFFTKTRAFNVNKARNLLNFEPEHDFKTEVKLIADWYQKNNWL